MNRKKCLRRSVNYKLHTCSCLKDNKFSTQIENANVSKKMAPKIKYIVIDGPILPPKIQCMND